MRKDAPHVIFRIHFDFRALLSYPFDPEAYQVNIVMLISRGKTWPAKFCV